MYGVGIDFIVIGVVVEFGEGGGLWFEFDVDVGEIDGDMMMFV